MTNFVLTIQKFSFILYTCFEYCVMLSYEAFWVVVVILDVIQLDSVNKKQKICMARIISSIFNSLNDLSIGLF